MSDLPRGAERRLDESIWLGSIRMPESTICKLCGVDLAEDAADFECPQTGDEHKWESWDITGRKLASAV